MDDLVKYMFVVGTLGVASTTGTLGSLLGAGGVAYIVYVYVAVNGKKRIKIEVLDEEAALNRRIAFLDKFLKLDKEHADKLMADVSCDDSDGITSDDVRRLRDLFTVTQPDNGKATVLVPTWDLLFRSKQSAEHRLNELKDMVQARVPQNEFAARCIGIATFLFPIVGIAAIGYEIWQDWRVRSARKLRAESDLKFDLESDARIREIIKQRANSCGHTIDIEPAPNDESGARV